jgi:hypothetical protein
MSEKLYTAKEVGALLRKRGWVVTAAEVEHILTPPDPYAESEGWEAGQIFVDATGFMWEFFPANYCGEEEDEPPVWNAFGDANTYAFNVPVRPLRGVTIGTESEVFAALAELIRKYDNESWFDSIDVTSAVRDLVDAYAKLPTR